MKSDPQGLSVLRMIQKYADTRRVGLTELEAGELLADQKAHENASLIPKEEWDDEI